MHSTVPVHKNDELTVPVDSLSLEGHGIARKDGFILFIPGALPGETCRIHVIKVTKSYAVAKLLAVDSPSPERVEPRCPVASRCGGCVLQHLAYPAQLRMKQQAVEDALTRIGGFESVPIRPILGMEDPFRYRNKASFPFGTAGGAAVFGFYSEHSHSLCPVSDCPIQSERALSVAAKVAEWANAYRIPVYDEATGRGSLRNVTVRTATTGETMAVIVTAGDLRRRDALLDLLGDVDSVWHNVNPDRTNVIFGRSFTLLAGSETITERIGDLAFSVSPQSFLQVNPVQTERLYGCAADLLSPAPSETVLDAYCGIGTISLLLAGRAGRVFGVEYVPEAIENARANACRNGIGNAEFFCGDAADVTERLCANERIDAILADPPRKGMDERMIRAILGSGVSRMVYVSCNPATLARDCKLLHEGGFAPVAVQPVDMFPHTGHVETVVLLTRQNT